MTDIVERLHGKVPMAWGDEGFMLVDEDAVLATFTEAADEIERLRALNDSWKLTTDELCEIIERLRAALQSICNCSTKMDYRKNSDRLDKTYKIARTALGEKE